MGHQDQFVPTSPSVGCAFGQETFAGMNGNGDEAPLPDLPALAPNGEVRPPKAAVRRARYRSP